MTSVQVSISADVATIDPVSNLLAGTGYYVQVASGAFKDLAGNNWAGISDSTSWIFTTMGGGPSTAPTTVDLLAASDTGSSNTDNLTNLDNSTAGKTRNN